MTLVSENQPFNRPDNQPVYQPDNDSTNYSGQNSGKRNRPQTSFYRFHGHRSFHNNHRDDNETGSKPHSKVSPITTGPFGQRRKIPPKDRPDNCSFKDICFSACRNFDFRSNYRSNCPDNNTLIVPTVFPLIRHLLKYTLLLAMSQPRQWELVKIELWRAP